VADEWQQRLGRRTGHEVIEGEAVSRLAERPACLDDFGVNRDVLEQLEHGQRWTQERGDAVEEHRARDVDEWRAAVGQRLETKIEHRAGQDGRAGHVAVDGTGGVAHTAAIKQLVSDHMSTRIENGLAGDVHHGTGFLVWGNRGHDRSHAIGRDSPDFTGGSRDPPLRRA
jgi:hypothetical protein